MTVQELVIDSTKLPVLRSLEARLTALIRSGDADGASRCSDLILELIGKRPMAFPTVIG